MPSLAPPPVFFAKSAQGIEGKGFAFRSGVKEHARAAKREKSEGAGAYPSVAMQRVRNRMGERGISAFPWDTQREQRRMSGERDVSCGSRWGKSESGRGKNES